MMNSFSLVNASENKDLQVKNKVSISFEMKGETKSDKPLDEITIIDITKGENVSPDLQKRITDLINQSQFELDKYRSVIDNNYKQVENKVLEVRRDVNDIYDFKDEIEANLNLAKWMIFSLSSGILCLTAIILVMWRGVVSVDRKDVELIFSIEKTRRDLKNVSGRLDLMEKLYGKDGK